MLVDFVSSWLQFRYHSIVGCRIIYIPRFLWKNACEGDGSGKRPLVASGNTPHKPEDKRRRSTGSLPVQRRNAKRLSFPNSLHITMAKRPKSTS